MDYYFLSSDDTGLTDSTGLPPYGEPKLPISTDTLFKEFNVDYRQNAIVRSGIHNFILFSEGYKIASELLWKQYDGSAGQANFIVYPLIFLNRQFIELSLKECITSLNNIINNSANFPFGHSLKDLWNTYYQLVTHLDENSRPSAELLDNVSKLIFEFDSIDPGSFSFRYPVNKQKTPSLKITNVDLRNFMETMSKLYNFFDSHTNWLYVLIDQVNEMRSENMFE